MQMNMELNVQLTNTETEKLPVLHPIHLVPMGLIRCLATNMEGHEQECQSSYSLKKLQKTEDIHQLMYLFTSSSAPPQPSWSLSRIPSTGLPFSTAAATVQLPSV